MTPRSSKTLNNSISPLCKRFLTSKLSSRDFLKNTKLWSARNLWRSNKKKSWSMKKRSSIESSMSLKSGLVRCSKLTALRASDSNPRFTISLRNYLRLGKRIARWSLSTNIQRTLNLSRNNYLPLWVELRRLKRSIANFPKIMEIFRPDIPMPR